MDISIPIIKKVNKESISDYSLIDFIKMVNDLNQSVETSLDSVINESDVFDDISSTDGEERLANILLMISLLFNRYSSIDKKIKCYAFQNNKSDFYSLFIEDIFEYIENEGHDVTIFEFLEFLSNLIIKRHLYESTLRLYDSGTKNWLFLEENGYVFSENKKIDYYARDNRWGSVRSLLSDLGLLNIYNDRLELSERGIQWLKRIG